VLVPLNDKEIPTKEYFWTYLSIIFLLDTLLLILLVVADFDLDDVEEESKLFLFIFLSVVFFPLTEEITYRLPLNKTSRSFLLMLVAMVITIALSSGKITVIFGEVTFLILVILFYKDKVSFTSFVVIASGCFALAHMTQYGFKGSYFELLIIPVFLISKFIPSLFMYLLRRHGMKWPIALHMLTNMIVTVPIIVEEL
jgi:ribose/xylose/arabinose/galactoside ABC-type transport system permease subunit